MIGWAGGKDDRYFVMFSKNTVSVYDTDSFGISDSLCLLDLKAILKVDHIVGMRWYADSILALIKGDRKQSPKVCSFALLFLFLFVGICDLHWCIEVM